MAESLLRKRKRREDSEEIKDKRAHGRGDPEERNAIDLSSES
jgi:hypothetical protein